VILLFSAWNLEKGTSTPESFITTNGHVAPAPIILMLMTMVFNFIDCMDMIVRTVFSRMLVFIFMNDIVMGVFMRVRVAVFMRMIMGVFVRVDLAFVRMFMIVPM
jgi:hypothetical protein